MADLQNRPQCSLLGDAVSLLCPSPPETDPQGGQHDEQDAPQDVRDRHVEDELVHLEGPWHHDGMHSRPSRLL